MQVQTADLSLQTSAEQFDRLFEVCIEDANAGSKSENIEIFHFKTKDIDFKEVKIFFCFKPSLKAL